MLQARQKYFWLPRTHFNCRLQSSSVVNNKTQIVLARGKIFREVEWNRLVVLQIRSGVDKIKEYQGPKRAGMTSTLGVSCKLIPYHSIMLVDVFIFSIIQAKRECEYSIDLRGSFPFQYDSSSASGMGDNLL